MADPRALPNIPALEPKFAAAEPNDGAVTREAPPSNVGELPLPYEPWRGTGFAPPPPAPHTTGSDVPAPLARPLEHARRPFEVSAALATFLPSCGSGSLDDRGCLTVGPGAGIELALLYRAHAFFAFGAEAAVSGFGDGAHGVLSKAGGGARFLGVAGRVYFADQGAWDPYLALTLGAGTLELRGTAPQARVATTGFGARVAGGLDYVLGSRLRVGPAASFSHWIAWSEQACASDICADAPAVYGRLLGFATLGLRVSGSFGDTL